MRVSCLKGKFVSHIEGKTGKLLRKSKKLYRTAGNRDAARVVLFISSFPEKMSAYVKSKKRRDR